MYVSLYKDVLNICMITFFQIRNKKLTFYQTLITNFNSITYNRVNKILTIRGIFSTNFFNDKLFRFFLSDNQCGIIIEIALKYKTED